MKCTICGKEVDPIVSRETLFCSLDTLHCGCGWPCFTRRLQPENVEMPRKRLLRLRHSGKRSISMELN